MSLPVTPSSLESAFLIMNNKMNNKHRGKMTTRYGDSGPNKLSLCTAVYNSNGYKNNIIFNIHVSKTSVFIIKKIKLLDNLMYVQMKVQA